MLFTRSKNVPLIIQRLDKSRVIGIRVHVQAATACDAGGLVQLCQMTV